MLALDQGEAGFTRFGQPHRCLGIVTRRIRAYADRAPYGPPCAGAGRPVATMSAAIMEVVGLTRDWGIELARFRLPDAAVRGRFAACWE